MQDARDRYENSLEVCGRDITQLNTGYK